MTIKGNVIVDRDLCESAKLANNIPVLPNLRYFAAFVGCLKVARVGNGATCPFDSGKCRPAVLLLPFGDPLRSLR